MPNRKEVHHAAVYHCYVLDPIVFWEGTEVFMVCLPHCLSPDRGTGGYAHLRSEDAESSAVVVLTEGAGKNSGQSPLARD